MIVHVYRSLLTCPDLHGWHILTENISKDAFHNSAVRYYPRTSLSGPREDVSKQVIKLITEQTTSARIIRIQGASGSSEIAQYISDHFSESDLPPTSFFFQKTNKEHFSSFIPTIAYQLCLIFPESRSLVSQAIDNDPAILSRSPLAQLEALIISPFTDVRRSWIPDGPTPQVVVIVDAIHGCNSAHQKLLIQTILSMAEHFAFLATFLILNKPTKQIDLAFYENATTNPIVIEIRSEGHFKRLARKYIPRSRTVIFFHFLSALFHCV